MESKKKKLPYIGYLVKALLTITVLISVTFSWFVFTDDAGIDSIDGKVAGNTAVYIKNSNDEWSDKLEINVEGGKIGVTQFSGNGEKLYKPIIEHKTLSGFYLAEEKDGFIEIETTFKTNGPISLYLSPNSSITPVDMENDKDYIAGAARVGFFRNEHDIKPFVWAPNSLYQFDIETGKVITNGEAEEEYKYVYSEELVHIESEEYNNISNVEKEKYGYLEDDNMKFLWGNWENETLYFAETEPIIRTGNNVNEEFEFNIRIRIWIEGTDREASELFIGGKFNVKLNFLAVENS